MTWEPFLAAGTILTIALGVGLVCATVGLTVAVLWRYLDLGFRLAVLRAWRRLLNYIITTAGMYFRRLMRYGHTKPSTTIAVVFSLVIWIAIAVSLAFAAYWRISVIVLMALPVAFLLAGWWTRGPAATRHKFDFACSFFEPAAALVVPSLGSKVIDLVLDALKSAL